jgi:hypothetical protein
MTDRIAVKKIPLGRIVRSTRYHHWPIVGINDKHETQKGDLFRVVGVGDQSWITLTPLSKPEIQVSLHKENPIGDYIQPLTPL